MFIKVVACYFRSYLANLVTLLEAVPPHGFWKAAVCLMDIVEKPKAEKNNPAISKETCVIKF